MRTKIFLLMPALLLTAFSCRETATDDLVWDEGIMATVPAYEEANGTKIDFNNGFSGFTWSNGDRIGVCRNTSSSSANAAFTLIKGGENWGNFINDSFALLPNAEYYAYYPFSADMTATSFPVNLVTQVQNGNNSASHIGKFNYMYTQFTTDGNGKSSFSFTNMGAVLQLHFTADEEDTYTSMYINSADIPFTIRASYNLTNGTYSPTYTQNDFRLMLGENGLHVLKGEDVTLNVVILPDDLSQSTLTFSVKNASGTVKEMSFAGYAFTRGKLYHFYEVDSKGNPPYGGCPDNHHPHMIDLGLPSGTLWSCMNMGAEMPTEAGFGFAWGQTDYAQKNYSNWSNYEFWENPGEGIYHENGITKYQIADNILTGIWYDADGNFIGDNKKILDSEDDAAIMNWGGKWRMPTKKEADELMNYTYQVPVDNYNETGTLGYIVYRKKSNGKYTLWDPHIFFPGWLYVDRISAFITTNGFWTTSLGNDTQHAISSGPRAEGNRWRTDQPCIRPVCSGGN